MDTGAMRFRLNLAEKRNEVTLLKIDLIKENIQLPGTFETSRKNVLSEEVQKARGHQIKEQVALYLAYDAYRIKGLDSFFSENYTVQ